MTPADLRAKAKRKRPKAQGRKVNALMMMVEMKRELQGRIFALEERVSQLESDVTPLHRIGVSNVHVD